MGCDGGSQGGVSGVQKRGQPVGAFEADPWETHAALTAAERDLLGNLRTQRGVVMQANEQVERLERSRMACWSRLVSALLQTYAPGSSIPTGGMFKPLEQLHRARPPLSCCRVINCAAAAPCRRWRGGWVACSRT